MLVIIICKYNIIIIIIWEHFTIRLNSHFNENNLNSLKE